MNRNPRISILVLYATRPCCLLCFCFSSIWLFELYHKLNIFLTLHCCRRVSVELHTSRSVSVTGLHQHEVLRCISWWWVLGIRAPVILSTKHLFAIKKKTRISLQLRRNSCISKVLNIIQWDLDLT